MRNLFFSVAILGALIWAMASAEGAIIALNWICFQRPQDFSDWWAGAPIFQIALAIAIVSNVVRGKFRPRVPGLLVVYYCLIVWIILSAAFAFDTDHAWDFCKMYLPSMIVTPFVMYSTINDLELLKRVMWVAAGSLGLNAFKVAVALSLHGGYHITEAVTGFVGDNNGFGLVLCLVVPILIGLKGTLPPKKWMHRGLTAVIVGASLCIIYTESRGALITLSIIVLLKSMMSKHAVRNTCIALGIAVLGYLIVPSQFFERLSTLKDVSADASAMGRIENWGLAWNEAKEFPFLGVGPDNHLLYNHARGASVHIRVAHSTYFEVLGENGFVGLAWYLMFLFTGIGVLMSTWARAARACVEHPELTWTRDLASWMTCAAIGYVVGSAFLNMLYFEFPWYLFFFGSMLRRFLPVARAGAISARRTGPAKQVDRPGRRLPRAGVPPASKPLRSP
ncbi:MAG TPA: putative O-glycosylation ligase, exosortase A system-associated [Steroidobacteraceae bacterium]|nr:putative O-glycosylation ligase, exosortase A system-associated [Steroidobacteraceae bacterium]